MRRSRACYGRNTELPRIDALVSLLYRRPRSEILRNMLMRGFTAVRDAGGAEFGLARAVEEDF